MTVELAEVLEARGQLVMHEVGQHLLQLQEQPFARRIVVMSQFVDRLIQRTDDEAPFRDAPASLLCWPST